MEQLYGMIDLIYPVKSWLLFLFFLLFPQSTSAEHLFLAGPWSSLSFTYLSKAIEIPLVIKLFLFQQNS